MNILTFDIETIPDVETGRKLYHLDSIDDAAVGEIMLQKRREETENSDFLPLHLHRIVAISIVLKTDQTFNVWSLGDEDSSEKVLIERFFNGIEKYTPILVSWNGKAFDSPVLHYRALLHGVVSSQYWETGEQDASFRWNNYLNRYHSRHTDMMDVIAGYQMRAVAKLHEVAVMLGFPGKLDMDGSKVWDKYLQGQIKSIRDYCETDVLNTYLIYQRFQLIQGKLLPEEYESNCEEVRQFLKNANKPHFLEFLKIWDANSKSTH